jgi:ribosomal protein S18 acetylase RimI-like enzyme
VDIRRIQDVDAVMAAGELFDSPPQLAATGRFLAQEGHHLLIAYVDDVPAGMITGVEMTHPDKGTELFLYELGVEEPFRELGLAKALVAALRDVAAERGCYGLWVVTGEANAAALATYGGAGGVPEAGQVVLAWTLDRAEEPTP